MEPLGRAKVTDDPGEVDLHRCEKGERARAKNELFTLERRVGLELLKLFMRYQIDLRILTPKGE